MLILSDSIESDSSIEEDVTKIIIKFVAGKFPYDWSQFPLIALTMIFMLKYAYEDEIKIVFRCVGYLMQIHILKTWHHFNNMTSSEFAKRLSKTLLRSVRDALCACQRKLNYLWNQDTSQTSKWIMPVDP